MKKELFRFAILSIFLSLSLISFAQNKGLYLGVDVGFDTPFLSEALGKNYQIHQLAGGEDSSIVSQPFQTLAKGYNLELQAGYMFNEFFGIELKGYYFNSPEWLLSDTTKYDVSGNEIGYYRAYTSAWNIRVAPSLVFKAGNNLKLNPYAKVGLMFPIAGKAKGTRVSNDLSLVNEDLVELADYMTGSMDDKNVLFDLEAEFAGKFSLGLETSIGASYNLNDNLELFGEFNFGFLRVQQKSFTVTKADLVYENGARTDIRNILGLSGTYQYNEFVTDLNLTEKQNLINASEDLVTESTTEIFSADGTCPENTLDLYNNEGVLVNCPRINDITLIRGLDAVTDYGTTADNPNLALQRDGAYSSFGINVGVKWFLNRNQKKTELPN